jgi:hypothetical protein
MAVQIINPVDTGLPMSPSTVEADTETEEEVTWVPLSCCSYAYYQTYIDTDLDEDIDV